MIKCCLRMSRVSSLILSMRSSRSRWIISFISSSSPCTWAFLLMIFSISSDLISSSSYWLLKWVARVSFSSCFYLSSYAILIYSRRLSSRALFVLSNSYSYFIAFSMASVPVRSFSSIPLIFLSNFYFFYFSLLYAFSFFSSSSISLFFSYSSSCVYYFISSFYLSKVDLT